MKILDYLKDEVKSLVLHLGHGDFLQEPPFVAAAVAAGYDAFTAGASWRDVAIVAVGVLVRQLVSPQVTK